MGLLQRFNETMYRKHSHMPGATQSSPSGSQHNFYLHCHYYEECSSNRISLCSLSLFLQGAPLPPALCPPLASGGPDYWPHPPHHEACDHLLESKVGLSPLTCWGLGNEEGEGFCVFFPSFCYLWWVGCFILLCALWDANKGELEPGRTGPCEHLLPTPHSVTAHGKREIYQPRREYSHHRDWPARPAHCWMHS